jgi:hypothetical protein
MADARTFEVGETLAPLNIGCTVIDLRKIYVCYGNSLYNIMNNNNTEHGGCMKEKLGFHQDSISWPFSHESSTLA